MIQNTKLIIFDWDDVFIIGSKHAYIACYLQVLKDLNIKMSRKDAQKIIIDMWGKSYQAVVENLLVKSPELTSKGIKLYEKYCFSDTFYNKLKFIDGGNKAIETLSQKYTLALATGQDPKIFEHVVRKFGIKNKFAKIVFSCEIKNANKQKPHPYALKKIMKDLGFKPHETVFVGDAENDMLMAKNAHVIPIAVLTGHLTKPQAQKLGVKYIIDNVTKLNLLFK